MTQALLKESILKWEEKDINSQLGARNCPLCTAYNQYYILQMEKCSGCVIAEHTGLDFCRGTPYLEFIQQHNKCRLDNNPENMRYWEELKEAEITFLKSLLTPEESLCP